MKSKGICLILILFFWIPSNVLAEDDFQYWPQFSFKMIDTERFDWITFAEMWIGEDVTKQGLHFVSQRLKFDYWDHLQLGFNYTYLNSRKLGPDVVDDDFKFQHRLEGEVNPHWWIGDWLKVNVRNRAEYRWIENNGAHNTRLRHRWTFTLPLKDSFFTSVYTSGELHYDVANHELNQNRMVPFGVRFRLNDKASMALYYMIQSRKGPEDWSSTQVLGTLLSIAF